MATKNESWYGYRPEEIIYEMSEGDLLFTDGKIFQKEKDTLEEIKNV